jgi:predicted DNA-binding transcriptional regulator AlpA
MSSIVTRQIHSTSSGGLRVRATASSGQSFTKGWDYAEDHEGMHRAIAEELAARLKWYGSFCAAPLGDGFVFVRIEAHAAFTVAPPEGTEAGRRAGLLVPEHLTRPEAAALLGLSPKTLEGWAKDKRRRQGPPYFKLGRAVRYAREALEQWQAEQQRTRTAGAC